MMKGKNNEKIVIFIVLVAVSLFIRIIFLSGCLFHHDSVQLAIAVEKTVETGELHPAVSGRYGFVFLNTLSYLILSRFTGDIDFILNLTTAFFASLSIGMIFLFINRLIKNIRVATITSFLFSFTPIFLSVTVYAKSHGIAFFFAITSGYFLLRAIENNKFADKIAFASFFFFSFTVRSTNIYYAFPFLLLTLFFGDKNKEVKSRIIDSSYVIGPVIIYLIANYNSLINESVSNRLYLSKMEFIFLLMKESIFSVYNTLTLLGVLVFFLGVYYSIKKRKPLFTLLALWFLPYYIYISLSQTFSSRFLIPVLLPLILIVALGLEFIYKKFRFASIAIFLLILLSFILAISPVLKLRHEYCGPKEFALFLKNMTDETGYIITNDEGVFFSYYSGRKTIGYPEFAGPNDVGNAVKQYYDLLVANESVYVTDKLFYYSDPKQSALVTLESNFILEKVGSALNEEYHHAELSKNLRNETIYRLHINSEIPLDSFRIMAYGR